MHTQNKSTAAGHTPGPWANNDPFDSGTIMAGVQIVAYTVGTISTNERDYEIDHRLRAANARLIAAAPELFGVVERLASWSGSEDFMSVSVREELVRQARAAIARAKGVQS